MKFLHIIKSPSYDSDGRLQKWLKGIRETQGNSNVFIVEDTNAEYKNNIEGDLIIAKKLFFRNFFKQRKGYPFKIIEYFFLTKNFIKKSSFDVIVFHDVQQYLNLTYCLLSNRIRKFKIVWDLHELPHEILFKFNITKKWLSYLLTNVDMVVYTNSQRRDYIVSKLGNIEEKSFSILNNFPEKTYISAPQSKLNKKIFDNDKPYILWLGMAAKGRNFDTFIEAFKHFKDQYNLVILGNIHAQFKEETDQLKSQGVLYNEFVKQEEIIRYIDNSYFSVVLYNALTPNNIYCEPNRLYQLISRNVPIIVGNNPVMKDIVSVYNLGYVLEDDGRNKKELIELIDKLIKNREDLILNSKKQQFEDILSWENQLNKILEKI